MMLFLIYFPAIFVHFQMNIELPVLHSTDVLLAPMKSEMDQLTKIRSHIRKVIPEALEARYADGRRTFTEFLHKVIISSAFYYGISAAVSISSE